LKNKILAIVGFSGTGKTVTSKKIAELYNIPVHISMTTRAPRDNEIDGVDYYFISEKEFNKLDLLEYTSYSGNKYGKEKNKVNEIVNKNKISIYILDLQGVKRLKEIYGDQVVSVLLCTSFDHAFNTLVKRDGLEKATKRFKDDEDINFAEFNFDYLIYNDSDDYSVQESKLCGVIEDIKSEMNQ
jgi:guanylate kinase